MKEKTILKVSVIAGITIVCTAMVINGNADIAAATILLIGLMVAIISFLKHIL